MLKEMRSYCRLKPGQDGTERLAVKCGAALFCVRYLYGEGRGVMLKTWSP